MFTTCSTLHSRAGECAKLTPDTNYFYRSFSLFCLRNLACAAAHLIIVRSPPRRSDDRARRVVGERGTGRGIWRPGVVRPVTAMVDGDYPYVFNNASVDAGFGVTSPITPRELTPYGARWPRWKWPTPPDPL